MAEKLLVHLEIKKFEKNERQNSDKKVNTDYEDFDGSLEQVNTDDKESDCPQHDGKSDDSECEESPQQSGKSDDSDCGGSPQHNGKSDEDSECEGSSQQSEKSDGSDCEGSQQQVNTNDEDCEHLNQSLDIDYDECNGSQHKQKTGVVKCNGSNAAENAKELKSNAAESLNRKPQELENTRTERHKPHQNSDHATQIHQTSTPNREIEAVKSGEQDCTQAQHKVKNDVPASRKLQDTAKADEEFSERAHQKTRTGSLQEPQTSHKNVKSNKCGHDMVQQENEMVGSRKPQILYDEVNAHNETCSQIHHSSHEESQAYEKNCDNVPQNSEHLNQSIIIGNDECICSQHKQEPGVAERNLSNAGLNTNELNRNLSDFVDPLNNEPQELEDTPAEHHEPHQNNVLPTQIHQKSKSKNKLETVKSGEKDHTQVQHRVKKDVQTPQKLQDTAEADAKCCKRAHQNTQAGSEEPQASHKKAQSDKNGHDTAQQKSMAVGSQERPVLYEELNAHKKCHRDRESQHDNGTCSQKPHCSHEEAQAYEKNYDNALQNSEHSNQSIIIGNDECNCSQNKRKTGVANCNCSNVAKELNNNLTDSSDNKLQARDNTWVGCHKPLQNNGHASQIHSTSQLKSKHELKTVKSGKQDCTQMQHQVKKDAQTQRKSQDGANAEDELYKTAHQNIQAGYQEPSTFHKNAQSDKNGHDTAKQKIKTVGSQEPQTSHEEVNAHEIDHDHDMTQQKVKPSTRELDESKKTNKIKEKNRDLRELKMTTDAVDCNNWTNEAETEKQLQWKIKTDSREFGKSRKTVENGEEDCYKMQRELYKNCQVNQHSHEGGKVKTEDKKTKQNVKTHTSHRRMTTDEEGDDAIELEVQTDAFDSNNSHSETNTNHRSHHKPKKDTPECEEKSHTKVKTAEKNQGDASRKEMTDKVCCENNANIKGKRLDEKLHQAAGNNISNDCSTYRDITNVKQPDRDPVNRRKGESKQNAHVSHTAHDESICRANAEGMNKCDKSCQTSSKWFKCSKTHYLKPSREASWSNSIVTSDVTTSSSWTSDDGARRRKGHKRHSRVTRSTARLRHLPSFETESATLGARHTVCKSMELV